MGVRVVMELDGDNIDLHKRRLEESCRILEERPGSTVVESCVITTGTVTIQEEINGSSHRRHQVTVR